MEDNKKKGLGMVLEGGGMRGLYTAGVLDELMEQGIYADSTVGVSAGAILDVIISPARLDEPFVIILDSAKTKDTWD